MPASPRSNRILLTFSLLAAFIAVAVASASAAQAPRMALAANAAVEGPASHALRAAGKRNIGAPGLLFSDARLGDFREIQSAPEAITEVPDPAGSGETVLKMTVNDKDVYPITPTENPRAQAMGPSTIEAGDEFWLQTKFLIPQNFPSVTGWMGLVSVYGAPFNGSSPWNISIADDEFRFQRNEDYNVDIPWRAPLVEGKWMTILTHERFAEDGFVEMWVNGQQIKFFPPGNRNPEHHAETTRLEMATMDHSNDGGPNGPRIEQYREAGMFESASVYFGALKLGETRASVEG